LAIKSELRDRLMLNRINWSNSELESLPVGPPVPIGISPG